MKGECDAYPCCYNVLCMSMFFFKQLNSIFTDHQLRIHICIYVASYSYHNLSLNIHILLFPLGMMEALAMIISIIIITS